MLDNQTKQGVVKFPIGTLMTPLWDSGINRNPFIKMLMPLAITVILFSSQSFAWETSHCKGDIRARKASLEVFGTRVVEHIKKHGNLPELCDENVPQVRELIPEVLESYLICGSSKQKEVYYYCFNENTRFRVTTERCAYNLSSKAVECSSRTAELVEVDGKKVP